MKKIADNSPWKMPATIDDPAILDEITQNLKLLGYAQGLNHPDCDMKHAFIMDPLESVKPWKDTSYFLMLACIERGHPGLPS